MTLIKVSLITLLITFSAAMADRSENAQYIITSDNLPSVAGFMSNVSGIGETNLLCNLGETIIATNGNSSYWMGQGFIHTLISDAFLQISKTVSNTFLGAGASKPIPGATIFYRINVSNAGAGDAGYSNIISDKLPRNTAYKSNSWTTNKGWLIEWSTNTNPSQGYNSPDYTVSESPPDKVRWVRWKKNIAPPFEGARFSYGVTIK